jgi:Electron transfer DM13
VSAPARRLWLLALVGLAGCGSQGEDAGKRFDPFTEVRDRNAEHTERASPRWERVTTLAGAGSSTRTFSVARAAIQWRVRWRCATGRLRLTTTSSRDALADAACPSRGTGTEVRTGAHALRIKASGGWRVVVEQQVDTPLREPPLSAMRSSRARVIARGRFSSLERRGRGTAALYRLPGRRLALRLEDFATSANSDLFVWLSTSPRPRTTVQAARAPHRVLAALKSTIGEQNYLIPRTVDAREIRSIIIWCVPVRIAYAAAPLRAAP